MIHRALYLQGDRIVGTLLAMVIVIAVLIAGLS